MQLNEERKKTSIAHYGRRIKLPPPQLRLVLVKRFGDLPAFVPTYPVTSPTALKTIAPALKD